MAGNGIDIGSKQLDKTELNDNDGIINSRKTTDEIYKNEPSGPDRCYCDGECGDEIVVEGSDVSQEKL